METLPRIQAILQKHFPSQPDPERAARECLQLHEQGALIFPEDFPDGLKEIPQMPPWLFVRGSPALLHSGACLAVVGTRRPSEYGLRAAYTFCRALMARGWCLVSGLARGIDTIAHSVSVVNRRPTVAVLGHGLDRIFPAQNRALAAEIVQGGGCLVSEFPPGTPPLPAHFPRRNRILSALACGVVVIEAGERSGSLITAHHAIDQNRQVFVVPGPFDEEGFRGSHALIRQGAQLVWHPQSVTDDLAPGLLPGVLPQEAPGEEQEPLRRVLKARGVASLEQLHQDLGAWARDLPAWIERGRQQGWLAEWGPQRFVYCGL
ncbi:DNA-processing protein DprA [bacterium]|nr:DNA-processing protein DprA [bacterium]